MKLNKNKKSLTERVLDYQKTGKDFHLLLDDLCLKIYNYPRMKYSLTEDDCSSFFLFFMPRLKKITHSFRSAGNSFETYFNSALYWHFKTYLKKRSIFSNTWKTASSYELWENKNNEFSIKKIIKQIMKNIDLMEIFMIDNTGIISDKRGKKQFLLFILKTTKDLDTDDLHQVAAITGYDCNWLIEIVDALKSTLSLKFQRLKKYRERRNRAFWRLKYLEKQYKNEIYKHKRDLLNEKIERTRETMRVAMNTISRIQLSPTHKNIASILGIPKGTVDSWYIRLKKKLKRVYQQKEKQYA